MSNSERRAGIIILDSMVRMDGSVSGHAIGVGTDAEALEETLQELHNEYGFDFFPDPDLSEQDSAVQLKNNGKSFFLSAETWKANWKPNGPKPNWKTDDGTPIQ